VDTDEVIAQLTAFPGETYLHFSPDGRFLAMDGRAGQQRTWDLASSPPALLVEQESDAAGEAFHPDGRHMVLTRTDGSILRFDLFCQHQPPQGYW